MKNLLTALLAVTLTTFCIAAEEEATVEQVVANPAKFEGKTVIFKGVELSGDIAEGPARYRIALKTKAGTFIDNKLRKDGVNFVIPKEKASQMTKGFKVDQFYPVSLTCKIERTEKIGWLATITSLVGAEGTLTGTWKGKYTKGAKGKITLNLLETSDGKYQGTWTDKEGTSAMQGERKGIRMTGAMAYDQTTVKVDGEIQEGRTLKINWVTKESLLTRTCG